jgi:hypothetical protein
MKILITDVAGLRGTGRQTNYQIKPQFYVLLGCIKKIIIGE